MDLPEIKLTDIKYQHFEERTPFKISYESPHEAHFFSFQHGGATVEINTDDNSCKTFKPSNGSTLILIGKTPITISHNDASEDSGEIGILAGSTSIDANVIIPTFPSAFLIEPGEDKDLEEINLLSLLIQKEFANNNDIEKDGIVRRASEIITILFVRIIRKHLANSEPNWPYTSIDSQITKALKIMQSDVSKRWTVEELASKVGVCRSSFSIRFRESVHDTPANYLSKLRVEQAAAILKQGRRSIYDIARAVGYNSELGFTKAFRKEFSVTPSQFRDNFKKEHREIT